MSEDDAKKWDVLLTFDNRDAAEAFFSYWLDGGGDGGGNIDFNTTHWSKNAPTDMRIEGTGNNVD